LGEFTKQATGLHKCCHRYFISPESEQEYLQKLEEISRARDHNSQSESLCHCSVLDLICQTNLMLPKEFQAK